MGQGVAPAGEDSKGRYEAPQGPALMSDAVPTALVIAAAWCWRLLVVAAAFLALVTLFGRLYLVVLPVFFALLLAALLHPMVALLRRWHLPRALATWGTVVIAFVVLGGIGWFVVQQAAANYEDLVDEVNGLLDRLGKDIDRIPGVNSSQLEQLQQRAVHAVEQHSDAIASGVLTAGTLAGEAVTGVIVMFFVTFFFLDEGDRMWAWTVRLFPRNVQASVRGAGYRAWTVLSRYIVGTAIIAAFHGTVIGLVLALLGVPLAAPLAVLVFLGSFIPIIGAVLFGGLAVLVTLITLGLVPAIILTAVLIVENQLEGHLLQPFIVGRAVKLHPVTIVLALTGGGLIAGLFGAILAIPIVAALHAAVKYLTGVEDLHGEPRRVDADRMAPEPPPEYAPLPLYATALAAPTGETDHDSTDHDEDDDEEAVPNQPADT